jgi:hypothetical protein
MPAHFDRWDCQPIWHHSLVIQRNPNKSMPKFMLILRRDITADDSAMTPMFG